MAVLWLKAVLRFYQNFLLVDSFCWLILNQSSLYTGLTSKWILPKTANTVYVKHLPNYIVSSVAGNVIWQSVPVLEIRNVQ